MNHEAIKGGIIGAVCSLLAIWLVFGLFAVALVSTNIYIAVTIAGFFSAFFAHTLGKHKKH